jgi:MOSC domain-containing protein YiiM
MNGTGMRLVSVNVSRAVGLEHRGRTVTTGIFKQQVSGRVATHGVNLDGDEQADRSAHGGPDRAAYAYASEDLAWWTDELGRPIGPGAVGENLTTEGLDISGARVGDRWRVGGAVFEVSAPRVPCFKLGIRMGDPRFPQRFARAGRPGAYLRIFEHGTVGAGDPIDVVHRPAHDVTVGLVARAYHDNRALAPLLLVAPELGGGWPEWARRVARGA